MRFLDKMCGSIFTGLFSLPFNLLETLFLLIPGLSIKGLIDSYRDIRYNGVLPFLGNLLLFPFPVALEMVLKSVAFALMIPATVLLSPYLIFTDMKFGFELGISDLVLNAKSLLQGRLKETINEFVVDFDSDLPPESRPILSNHSQPESNDLIRKNVNEETYQDQVDIIQSDFPKRNIGPFEKEYKELICPLILELPNDPVRLKCIKRDDSIYIANQHYERKAINESIKKQGAKNPLTREKIIEILPAPDITSRIKLLCNIIKIYVTNLFFAKEHKNDRYENDNTVGTSQPKRIRSNSINNPYGLYNHSKFFTSDSIIESSNRKQFQH